MKRAIPFLVLLCACAPGASSVFVELRTDLIPGIEFERIEVVRFGEDGTELLRQEVRRLGSRDFVQGAQVAQLQGEDGDWLLEVRLRDARDGLVVAQPVLVTVSGDTIVTALISRECRGVECPAALGNATHTACLAGECVNPRCTLESLEECGAPQCDTDESCGSVECGAFECLDGYCFASSGTGEVECGDTQYCDPSVGCRAIPTGADMDRDRWNDFEDCDDNNPRINPGASELCNGVDDDCDGVLDEGLPGQPFFRDEDGDGFGSFGDNVSACTAPEGYVAIGGDCNDRNDAVSPGAMEVCDGVDNNCDGFSDDQDGDGHSVDCEGGPLPADDCDDLDPQVFPEAPERCDAQDNDCDEEIDEAPNGWFLDYDGDGYGINPVPGCQPGAVDNGLDCIEGDPFANPGVLLDPCGGRDQDCDGELDEDPNVVWYVDADGDGVGVPGESITSCEQPEGYGATTLDCDDADPTRGGGLPELCDGEDNDCDPNIDEEAQTGLAANQNGVCLGSRNACVGGVEVAPDRTLIADYEADEATCELMDNDCDGETDEGLKEWLYVDRDGDGYGGGNSGTGLLSVPELLCRGLPQVAEVTGDCADSYFGIETDSRIHPGAVEGCDGVDQDCDGATDEGTCAAGSLCAGASGCVAEVMPPTTLSGVIETHTAWQGGGDILVDGIVIIDSGASLSVGPGTRFRFQPGAGFSVLGRLSAYGTDDAPVVFASASSAPSPTSWEGIATGFSGETTVSLSHCEVRDARVALGFGSGARSCLFENNALAFTGNNSNVPTCVDCVVEATGLMVANRSATFVRTRLVGGRYDWSVVLLDSEMLNTSSYPFSSELEVINSTVRGFPDRNVLLRTYESHLESFFGTTSPSYIVRSTFVDVAIRVRAGSFPPFVATESSLCSTDGRTLVTLSGSDDVDLSNNYWCTTDTAEIDALIFDDADDASLGRVNYTPFLTEAHPLAP